MRESLNKSLIIFLCWLCVYDRILQAGDCVTQYLWDRSVEVLLRQCHASLRLEPWVFVGVNGWLLPRVMINLKRLSKALRGALHWALLVALDSYKLEIFLLYSCHLDTCHIVLIAVHPITCLGCLFDIISALVSATYCTLARSNELVYRHNCGWCWNRGRTCSHVDCRNLLLRHHRWSLTISLVVQVFLKLIWAQILCWTLFECLLREWM
jgi:hypothetical protein